MSKHELSISERCQKIITQVYQDDLDEAFGLIKKEERAEPLLSSEGMRKARNTIKKTAAQVKQGVQADINEAFGHRPNTKDDISEKSTQKYLVDYWLFRKHF